MKIIKTGNLDILKHPICEAFLDMKDSHIGVHFRRAYFIFYVLFLISVTGLVFTNHSQWFITLIDNNLDIFYYGFLSSTLFFVVILVIKEILTVIFFWNHFIHNKENILWIALLNIVTIYSFTVSNRSLIQEEFSLQLGTAAIFLSWIYITFVIGRFPSVGIYILMVKKVSKVLILFLLLFSCSLVAFALSFHLILNGDGHEDPLASFITTLSMMFGELDFASKFYNEVIIYQGITQFMGVSFIIFIGIVIMNFLIGLSIDNISTLFQTAGVSRLKLTVEHLSIVEGVLLKFGKVFKSSDFASLICNLQRYNKDADPHHEVVIYILPNAEHNKVFVKDKSDKLIETKFKMPKWVTANVIKILRENELKNQVKKIDHEKDNTVRDLRRDVVGMKKDMKSIRKNIQVLCEMVKMIKK